MGKVRARKENGNLYLDFMYKNIRCREQTELKDTPANRKKVEALMQQIEAMIVLDNFNYAETFPTSKNIRKFAPIDEVQKAIEQNGGTQGPSAFKDSTPLFKEFVEQWYLEKTIEWRKSHLRSVRSMLDRCSGLIQMDTSMRDNRLSLV